MKIFRPIIRNIKGVNGYHIELTHKESTMTNSISCYMSAIPINGDLSNNKDAIRLDITPDRKPIKVFLDGEEHKANELVVIL